MMVAARCSCSVSVAVPAPSVYRCALSSVATVSCCRSHRCASIVSCSHLCRCRGDGRRSVIGGHCQPLSIGVLCHRWPLSAVAALIGAPRLSAAPTFAGVVVMSEGAPWPFLLRPSIDTAVMVAVASVGVVMSEGAPVFLLCVRVRCSHRSEVATIADGQTVRPAPCRWVRFVIGGHCQLLPLSSVRLDCQLLPPLPVSW